MRPPLPAARGDLDDNASVVMQLGPAATSTPITPYSP